MKMYLSHKIDSFGFAKPQYFALFEDGTNEIISKEEIIKYDDEIITYNLGGLLFSISEDYSTKLPYLTDISQLIRLNCGKSRKSYLKNREPWKFWNRVKRELGKKKALKLFEKYRSSDELPQKELLVIAKVLKRIYNKSIKIAQDQQQLDRFYELENEIQQILNHAQLKGITIDIDEFASLSSELKSNKDSLIKKLRYKYGLTDLSFKSIREFLNVNGFKVSKKEVKNFNLIAFLKANKISSNLCKDLYIALINKLDYENISKYIVDDRNLIYPEYECIGTVTSRILVKRPLIQQLKTENRIIFKAKDNHTLLYCDYKQFEPGILASFSSDREMKKMYNSGDIYSSFSEFIFGNSALRKDAKILFLAYLYGMSNKKVKSNIEKIIKTKGLTKGKSAEEFFKTFSQLESYKNIENEKAIENGFIKSQTALRRNLIKTKRNKARKSETRFVLSQLIQGTASYILKKSILDVMKDDEIEFLVPMHDAVLFQVPSKKLSSKKIYIEKCFVDNYKSICPDINARVDFKPFHE